MDNQAKQRLLSEVQAHLRGVQEYMKQALQVIDMTFEKQKDSLKRLGGTEKQVQYVLSQYNKQRLKELHDLYPSPYFVRCDVAHISGDPEQYYFAKFSFPEAGIYSWITPAARMRFESPGDVSYTRPDGSEKTGELTRKDQYLVTDGQVVFFATEQRGKPRELVYQAYFSTRKTGFVLPEIVEQMEKAQDTVIRASHRGPFVITGPAGSGKTTLALHRIAYLMQSPETSSLFSPSSMLVLVQDTGTKEYFSHLLPELGIQDVQITTFAEWAYRILGIAPDIRYKTSIVEDDAVSDRYEYIKLQALRQKRNVPIQKDLFRTLHTYYEMVFSTEDKELFLQQQKSQVLDRIDLTILLHLYHLQNERLTIEDDYFVELKDGTLKKKHGRLPLEYGLIVIDEFQNYLPEQLKLIKSTLREQDASVMYIGDMAQQVQLGTIRDWSQIREVIPEERLVKLQKVYRNTRQILEYIGSLGYVVSIPDGVKQGTSVGEYIYTTIAEQVQHIFTYVQEKTEGTIGILAKDVETLNNFSSLKAQSSRVHVLTMAEAQGVEFDVVFLVGVEKDMFAVSHLEGALAAIREEKQRVYRDLLYVALTRAMNELYVLGAVKLSEVVLK